MSLGLKGLILNQIHGYKCCMFANFGCNTDLVCGSGYNSRAVVFLYSDGTTYCPHKFNQQHRSLADRTEVKLKSFPDKIH